jgi:hypothetical protein
VRWLIDRLTTTLEREEAEKRPRKRALAAGVSEEASSADVGC